MKLELAGRQTSYSDRVRAPVLNRGTPSSFRKHLLQYFQQTYLLSEHLFEDVLSEERSYYTRGDALRHPLIFYYGHTAAFYMNKLVCMKITAERVNPKYESVFAVGVDEMSWDDLNQKNYDWPSVKEVKVFRNQVKAQVERLIDEIPVKIPVQTTDPAWIILMAIEHELIHFETSSVLIRQLPLELVRVHENWKICPDFGDSEENELIELKGGTVTLGRDLEDTVPQYYHWDNETGTATYDISKFSVSKFLVSNGDFLEFVNSDGYKTEKFWTENGWNWRHFEKATMPRFWRHSNIDQYRLRLLTSEIDLPLNWPVEVNMHEAQAYCSWLSAKKGITVRLPTEAEFAYMQQKESGPQYPKWAESPANIDLSHYASPCPVNKHKQGKGRIYDLIGNVWQWTSTDFYPFQGFHTHPGYDDYSIPLFDGQHSLMLGGSWATVGEAACPTVRYAFRPHFYQHAGFRYVHGSNPPQEASPIYETDAEQGKWLEFDYGEPEFVEHNFCTEIVRRAVGALTNLTNGPFDRALDVGCSVGRRCFELSRHFDKVIGIEPTTKFIRPAWNLRDRGSIKYTVTEEGELFSCREFALSSISVSTTQSNKIEFIQADPSNMKPILSDFNLIIAANLIDRIYDPEAFLISISDRLAPGGLLAISSSYDWKEKFTDKNNWIGGRKMDGENMASFSRLQELLKENFELVSEPEDLTYAMRHSARKVTIVKTELTLWAKI